MAKAAGKATTNQILLMYDKLEKASRSDKLRAASAVGFDTGTAKSLLLQWQRNRAQVALGNVENPTREQLQAAAAVALGIGSAID